MRLVYILIIKSVADTILVGSFAVLFYMSAFPPHFRGWGEATPDSISGWAVNQNAPWDRVELQLFIDGRFIATGVANRLRPDVLASGWSLDEWNGYQFEAPDLEVGEHIAHVYAVHESGGGFRRTLQLVGNPIRFTVDKSGRLTDVRRQH